MKIIQVPMDEMLLQAINRQAKAKSSTRAALIRAACEEYLQKFEEAELDRRYLEGYRPHPEKAGVGRTGAKLAARVWPKEDWEEAR